MVILCEFYIKPEKSPIDTCTMSWRSMTCTCLSNQTHCDLYDFLKEKEIE